MVTGVFIKRWLRRALVACAAVVLLLIALAVVVQTPPAKRAIAALVSRLVAEHTRFTLRIDGVAGTLPHALRVARVELSDAGGRVVSLHGIETRLALLPLLRGQIHLNELTLDHVELWRRPTPQQRWRIPRPPQLPLWPTVDTLHVERVSVDAAVAGVPARLTVTGRVKAPEGSGIFSAFPEVALEMRALDAAGMRGSINYSITEDAPLLSVVVEDDQLLPALLDVAPPVSVRVEGKGTRADWRASLTASAGGDAIADGSFCLTEGGTTALAAAMEMRLAALPPLRPYTGMLGDTVTLQAAGSLDRSGTLRITSVALDSDMVALALQGAVNFEQDTVELALSLDYADARRLPGMNVLGKETPLRFMIDLGGMFTAPEITLAADVDGMRALDGAISAIINESISATGGLRITPPVLLREMLPMLPDGDSGEIAFSGSYSEETGELDITALEARGMGVDASLRARITPELPDIDVNAVVAIEELSRLEPLLPLPLSGGARLEIAAANDNDRLNATASAEVVSLDTAGAQLARGQIKAEGQWDRWFSTAPKNMRGRLHATADGLQTAGMNPARLSLSADIDAPTLEEFRVASLTVTDGNVTLDGAVEMNLDAMTFDAAIEAVAPSLASLPLALGALPDGELRLHTKVAGALTPPSIAAVLTGQIQAPQGILAVAGNSIAFDLTAAFENNTATLSAAQVSGDTFSVDGAGLFNWDDRTVQAEVRAALPDLAAIGEVLERPLSGAITFKATATGALPNLNVQAQAKGDALTYAAGPPVAARLDVRANDVPARFAMTATGEASGAGETLTLDLRAALEDERIVLSPLTLAAGANHVSGQATYALGPGTPEAWLEVVLADLGALAAPAGIDMSGRATATLHL
ncbi:MAG TPA: hypothetical protein ENN65_07400, partial [Candidatus Hydrogenedentes bacterium]|nr:hypothetical protein [Candidatus Hydrogenedentota bacterium]